MKYALLLLLTTTVPAFSFAPAARAQDDPFRTSGAPATATPPTADETPAAEKPAAEPAEESDPFVRAILEVKPTTAEQRLQDVQALLNLNRPELAKQYLAPMAESMPAAAELAKLQARFGSAFFLRLATTAAIQPEGAAVANAVTEAAVERIRNTQRLVGLIDRLGGDDAAAKRLAMADLVEAATAAAPELIHALGDAARASERGAIADTLVAIGDAAVDPLIATLESDDSSLTVQAVTLLGRIGSRSAVPFLLGPALSSDSDPALREAARQALLAIRGSVPSQDQAMVFLKRRLDAYLAGTLPAPVDESGKISLWMWDASQAMPRLDDLPSADAAFVAAQRMAAQLHAVAPSDTDSRLMYLATSLEVAKRLSGYDRPLTEQSAPIIREAAAAGTGELQDLLTLALDRNMPGAAMATIDLLAATKDAELLRSTDGRPRLLARALLDPNRRVKFAAARAIMQLDPQSAYPGSSYLIDVLGFLATSGGRRRVIVGDPRAEVARTLAGQFDQLGFDVDTRTTGRQVILQAFDSPDYALALIGDAIDHPPYRDVLETLRQDPRTADMPIGLMVRDFNEEPAQWITATDPLTLTLAQPQTLEDVAFDTRRLLAAAGRRQVSGDERTREALFALDALAQLAEDPAKYGFYDVLRVEPRAQQALLVPSLASQAARVLGLIGSPGAQQALVEYANAEVLPLADRQAAAAAFGVAVGRRGLLLTKKQLLHQYDVYNASEVLDKGSQAVLASILDTIETPTRTTDHPQKDD